jgi:hypothetical protein
MMYIAYDLNENLALAGAFLGLKKMADPTNMNSWRKSLVKRLACVVDGKDSMTSNGNK